MPVQAMEVSQNTTSDNSVSAAQSTAEEVQSLVSDLVPTKDSNSDIIYSKQLMNGVCVSSEYDFGSEVAFVNQVNNQSIMSSSGGVSTELRWGDGTIFSETFTDENDEEYVYTHGEFIGTAVWKKVPGSYGYYELQLENYNENTSAWDKRSTHYLYGWGQYESSDYTSFDLNWSEKGIRESGQYRFRVRALNSNRFSSYSSVFHYTRPDEVLDTPTNLNWNKNAPTVAQWESVEGAIGYNTNLYISKNGYNEEICSVWSHRSNFLSEDFYRSMNKNVDYVYDVGALSKNISLVAPSEYSETSQPYAAPSKSIYISETLNKSLNEVELSGDYEAAKAMLDAIDVKELAVAMQSNPSVRDLLEQLEASYIKDNQVSVNTIGTDQMDEYMDLSRVSVLGAGLNADENQNEVSLKFANPKSMDEELYHNGVSFSISMNGVTSNEALRYPIRITVPIPSPILIPEYLYIVHVHQDGTKETIYPTLNGDGTASFTVTSFSDFIFAQEQKDVKSIEIRKINDAVKVSNINLNGRYASTILGVYGLPDNDLLKGATWTCSDESVLTISSNDIVSDNDVSENDANGGIQAQTIKVTAESSGDAIIEVKKGESLVAKCYVRVVAKDLSANDVRIMDSDEVNFWSNKLKDYTYTGKAINPEPDIYANGKQLIKNVDYTLKWKNNINVAKDPKKLPTVIITGKGSYTNTLTLNYNILRKDISANDIVVDDIVLDTNGKLVKAKPIVKMGTTKLVNGKDYKLTYVSENSVGAFKDPGQYEILVEGIGNFMGSRTVIQTIIEDDQKLVSSLSISKIKDQKFDYANITPSVVVRDGLKTLTEDSDYKLLYADNYEIGKASVTVSGIGQYVGTKTVYFNIVGIPLKSYMKLKINSRMPVYYTGEPVIPVYEITNTVKDRWANYEMHFENNVNAGKKAKMILTSGKGFTGTIVKTFEIKPRDINDAKPIIEVDDSVNYQKGGAIPSVSIKLKNGTKLVEGKDYTLSFKNNTKVTTSNTKNKNMPYVIIKGKGNYTKSIKVFYSITTQSLKEMSIQAPDMAYSIKAGKELSIPVLADKNGKKLVVGIDYDKNYSYTAVNDITLENNSVIKAGDSITRTDILPSGTLVKLTVKGKGAYTGSHSTTYMISKKDLGKAKVKIQNKYYTGDSIVLKPQDIVIKYADGTILSKDDYTIVSYSNNEKVGTAKVKIQGINNYSGTKEYSFKIVKRFIFW